ncbi:hypothetical protein KVV02_008765 [Mortierella alpina]|uniref:Uncharacterized protein n=1 Tax=Mortierella alpina TaxID=64518 RepID=A0A9P8D273_MORAP|nr:hypothetical protein KVV02_008765 [Mortierella alpina]
MVSLPLLATAAPASSSSSQLVKRAPVEFIADSEPSIELTFEANDSYYLQALTLNQCQNQLVLPENGTHVRPYYAITTPESAMGINFYLDENCQEYDFSVLSEVREFVGAFASLKYVGEFKNAKTGFYENTEFSTTVFPDSRTDPGPPESGRQPLVTPGNTVTTTGNAGLAVGMGIIGMVLVLGIVGVSVLAYRRFGPEGRRRGGDGGAFMTLSTSADAEEQVGLTGENGPHSSAVMQSRVGVSFDDERYPAGYRDEEHESSDEGEVELGYPKDDAEAGLQPQNAKLQ